MRWSSVAAAGIATLSIASAGGCASIQAVEPVIAPPAAFRFNTIAPVEFVAPWAIGLRCAERGAKFMGVPALNSGACADSSLITMIDPCQTLTAGSYARDLCTEVRRIERLGIGFDKDDRPIQFVSASAVGPRCADYDIDAVQDTRTSCLAGGVLVIANPCDLAAQGWYERVFCHELAHANGWAPNHHGGEPRAPLRLARESPEAMAFAAARQTAGLADR